MIHTDWINFLLKVSNLCVVVNVLRNAKQNGTFSAEMIRNMNLESEDESSDESDDTDESSSESDSSSSSDEDDETITAAQYKRKWSRTEH